LIFLNDRIYFYCREAFWREDFMAETALVHPKNAANTLGRKEAVSPLRRFAQHLEAYTPRALSKQMDIWRAFLGIETFLEPYLANTDFCFGMPTVAFDWAILWSQPANRYMTRREGFPSWSWMGYEGAVQMAPDHGSEFDQKWLRKRTWIDWVRVLVLIHHIQAIIDPRAVSNA